MTILVAAVAALAAGLAVAGLVVYARAPAPLRAYDLLVAGDGRRTTRRTLGDLLAETPIAEGVAADLRRAGMTISASSFLLLLVVAFVFALLVLPGLFGEPIGGVAAAAVGIAPYVVVKRRAGRHAREFAIQLPAVLDLLANALRAGQTEAQAIALVAEEMHGAASEEFGRMSQQLGLGANVDAVTQQLLVRLPSPDLELLVDAVQLAHRVGGNLAQMLADIAGTIRERTRLEGEIRALTAQSRASLYLVTALAPIGLLFISLINPDWGALLFQTGIGRIVLGAAAGLEVAGFFVAQRAAVVKV